jgi:hypothetical protein
MNKKRTFWAMLAGLLILGLVFTACKTGNDPQDTPPETYTYTSGEYEITIVTDPASGKAVLADGQTGTYTLKYRGAIVSTGRFIMAVTVVTFTPNSPGSDNLIFSPFLGTLDDNGLTFTSPVTITVDGNTVSLPTTMTKPTTGDSGDDTGAGGDDDNKYVAYWGAFTASPSVIEGVIRSQGWNVTRVDSNSAYATGATATAIYYYNIKQTYFTDYGTKTGSFDELLNYSADGVTYVPLALKTALINNKNKVPLAAIFDAGSFAVTFYITKN